MGIGECQELAFRHAVELLKSQHKDFLVIFANNPKNGIEVGSHVFIVTKAAEIDKKNTSLSGMSSFSNFLQLLPKDSLLIDPLLNYVGDFSPLSSHKASHHVSSYYSSMSLSTITTYWQFTSKHIGLSHKIESQARGLIESLKATNQLQYSSYKEHNYTNLKQSIIKLKKCEHPKIYTGKPKPKRSHKTN